ncbi:hypothetical protein TVAG_203570 [Trichomonas vaginalis G3]|uniref:Uncharacterized protein n=1 Tax=Trichomonas vaginalis (strain ATCC PRA-98 / G3) TaxID=412133 RepID=A2ETD3_TRIV3|nr:acetylornithine deacetylase family [Trichomonas vaginalis G3]EAY04053.1 hypothetical protein TVAG_203570 [Trichomonas vaginalis G3]KAI5544835.1 acetylornithine deacetylase family [Trichomonas vaginalis G3]|eukprot:XP_001316276.1 hypothetical protein [Trichomonas vaginalis G3]
MGKIDAKSILFACFLAGGKLLYDKVCKYLEENEHIDHGIIPKKESLTYLDNQIATTAQQYQEFSMSLLNDILKFPHSFEEKPIDLEKKFMDYLRQTIINKNAVFSPGDVKYDKNRNLVWMIANPTDPVPFNERKVIFMNSSIKNYEKGSARDMQGFVTQFMTSKILLETIEDGSLNGVIVVCSAAMGYHRPYHVFRNTKLLPDCIIICEPTGDSTQGPLGISIGQKGYSKIAISFSGDDAKLEELEKLIANELQATPMSDENDPIVGQGSIGIDKTPKDQDDKDKGTVYVRRNLGLDETWENALNEVKSLPTIKAHDEDTSVAVTPVDNVPAWKTPRETRAILAATESYRRVVSPWAATTTDTEELRVHPFFKERQEPDNLSSYPVREEVPPGFEWVEVTEGVTPPTFAIGAGFSDTTDETVRGDHVQATAAVMSRFPSLFVEEFK